MCKEAKKNIKLRDAQVDSAEITQIQLHRSLLEDWIELHRFTLIQAIAVLIRAGGKYPVDFRAHRAHFSLDLRDKSKHDGNPSTVFDILNISYDRIRPNTRDERDHLQSIAPLMPVYEANDTSARKEDVGYMSTLR